MLEIKLTIDASKELLHVLSLIGGDMVTKNLSVTGGFQEAQELQKVAEQTAEPKKAEPVKKAEPKNTVKEAVDAVIPEKKSVTSDELKELCAKARAAGVKILDIFSEQAGVTRFSMIPEDKLQAVYEAVEKAMNA